MDDERQRKLEAGREKLEMYKKKKHTKRRSSSSQSDTSFSLTPPLPADNVGALSDSSTVSEHLNSNSDSVENDRSFQEIEISNVPIDFILSSDDDVVNSLNLLESLGKTNKDVANNVQSILDEILRSDQFQSDPELTLPQSEDVLDSNENSFNLFKDVNLNDSLIHEYVQRNTRSNSSSLNTVNLNLTTPAVDKNVTKVKQLEELLNTKDTTIAVLTAELESLRELTSSNQSTLSLNTSTTDYKQYHDEFQNKIVEFQNALSHRDSVIQQLTEALQQSVINREQLQEQGEYFSKEIVVLQKQLVETSAIIAQHKWDVSDSIRSIKDNSIQTDSLPSQILQEEVKILRKNPDLEGDMRISILEPHYLKLEATLSSSQMTILNELKKSIDLYVQQKDAEFQSAHRNELKILEDKFESEKVDHETETARLRELLGNIKCDSTDIITLRQELEAKHAKEVEELRTYFEQKCADVEKNYSEEVFSQQSRKMSGSSSSSEASDFIFSSSCPRAGPAGDARQLLLDTSKIVSPKRDLQGLTKADLVKLKTDLAQIADDLSKYNLDSISKQDVLALGSRLTKYDLRCLLKYDLTSIKVEMQNKYHAELEILREDYENRIDTLNIEYESRLQGTEAKYVEQIETLKFELDEATRNAETNVSTAVQEVASSGEYELAEVVHSYERRLQEQVTLAKIDIINALEHQIQMLVANTAEDAEWPVELLQIRNRFTEKYVKQIAELEEKHQEEVSKLKEEHLKILNGALERARRKSLRDDSLTQTELDIIKERDAFRKTTTLLRQLIGELMKYFSECEDELNNTLIEQLLKHGFDKSLTELEADMNLNESSASTCSDSATISNKKRVHFAPKFDEIMATIDNSVPSSLDSNISVELKNELGACLNRLKADANAILALSISFVPKKGNDEKDCPEKSTSLQDRVVSLTKRLILEGQVKKDLSDELEDARQLVQNLEAERANLEGQIEEFVAKQNILEADLHRAHKKISELIESGHKEIISEGYGENLRIRSHSLGDRIATLSDLQERARNMVAECASNPDHPLLQLVEELCREGDRITEQAKSDHEDFQQQQVNVKVPLHMHTECGQKIEAADKKLRATCQFLEEQAAEREQERDEAQREIASLHEELRERERDRKSCERINNEIEHLEQQMREMSKLLGENDAKQNEIEAEKKEAIEKIFVLRDIIRDLESQIEIKTENEVGLKALVVQLEDVIKQQNKTNEELSRHLNSAKSVSEVQQLQQHVEELQDEVQRLRLNSEFVGSEGALKQIKTQLNEFETNIDKWTRDLEALHSAISATSCSSPSEDMSIRDQIRPRTPSALEECDVPLQQLARLKEKLVKHSRAEDAAVKRIHDLEMELDGIKHDLDEVQNERDILQDQVSEQLVLISSLQMRLDDQRLRADQVQKQTNTSLEVRIYDLENEIKSLMEIISVRDKTAKHLNKTIEETRKRLMDQEQELTAKQEDKVILDIQRELEKVRAENASLLVKINNDAQNAQVLPNLVDNILADKNKDIEMLREKLNKTQSELDSYLSLNLDHEQLKTLSKFQSSERAFADILSLIDLDASDTMRKVEKGVESLSNSANMPQCKRNANETTFIGSDTIFPPELSSIEKVGRSNINYSIETPLTKPNSTELQKSTEKRVHFDDSIYNIAIERLQSEILELKNELFTRDEIIKEYAERVTILSELENNIQTLQEKLDFTENALQKATETFEKEQDALRLELAEKKMHLMENEKQLQLSEQDANRKDQMYINLAKEKRELEKTLKQLQDNNHEIQNLKTQLAELGNTSEKMKRMETALRTKQDELETLRETFREAQKECDGYKAKIKEKDELNAKLEKDLKNKESQLDSLTSAVENKNAEVETLKQSVKVENEKTLAEFETNLKDLKTLLVNKETEIEILNEDAQRYQEDLSKLENQLKITKRTMESEHELKLAQKLRENAAKDLQIVKLSTDIDDCNREINHLRELLNEKDRIVSVMSDDSRSLRSNLETIQSKMQESGNVVDLKRRLEDEQRLSAVLREELRTSKCTTTGENKPADMTASMEEITGEVRKQLDYSAHLDSNILSVFGSGDDENLNGAQQSKRAEFQEIKQKYEKEKEKVGQLEKELKTEKQNSNAIQLEDADMLEQLRIRLETALESEIEIEKLLVAEKRLREDLQVQVENLKLRLAHLNSAENSKTEVTEYKSLPTLETQELMRLRKDLPILQEENYKLKADLKNTKKAKNECEATLKYTKDMLQLKNDEVGKLEKQIAGVQKSAKEKLAVTRAELEQKTRETENSRILIGEMEQEAREMKKEIESLNENLRKGVERENKLLESATDAQMKQTVPDKFLNKMKDLSNLVKEHIKDNKQMTETVEKLTNERLVLQERIKELEDLNHIKVPFDDPVERANHLFARYLRAESYRKALIWQKRYLVALLASYQTYPLFSRELPIPSTCAPIVNRPARSSGITRFKAVASAVVAAIRMQFLVQRWHSGKRGFVLSYSKRTPRSTQHITPSPKPPSTAHFQVGQPVSNQNFPIQQQVLTQTNSNLNRFRSIDVENNPTFQQRSESRRSTTPTSPSDLGPWSGATPPSRDGKAATREFENVRPQSGSSASNEDYVPLQAPYILSRYIERFDQIQQKLGMTMDKHST